MRINELFENENSHVAFCFGRMNPPTVGHKKVFDTLKSLGDYKIFLSQTQDKKENPLSYSDKIKFIKELYPEHSVNVVENPKIKTVLNAASFLYDQGFRNATFVAGDDRLDQFKKILNDYNGVDGKAHGFYKFGILEFKSSGSREDGVDDSSGVSATAARQAAVNNNFEEFTKAVGNSEIAKEMFAAVKSGLGISK